MAIICVSGTPGTGKTTVAKILSSALKHEYVDVTKLIKRERLYDRYDSKHKSYEVDIKKLTLRLAKTIAKNKKIVIDSHLSHYLPKKYVDFCVVCKCELKELKKRLEKRRYSKAKVRENLDAEIFDVCLNEALENELEVSIMDTSSKHRREFKNSMEVLMLKARTEK
jgi:adenylate kinase